MDALHADDRYQQVVLTDGARGFLAADSLRSLLDYRLAASSRSGEWSITSFVAGGSPQACDGKAPAVG